MLPVIQIKDLAVSFFQDGQNHAAVNNISFNIPRGKITALIGESGSGKSATALSLMRLLPASATVSGEIIFSADGNHSTNILSAAEKKIRSLRGNKMAMIFQEPMTSLNPVMTCGAQVAEALTVHKKINKVAAKKEVIALFEKVKLPQPAIMYDRYPHQISGGQKQRVMIAMAMSCSPALLIADEPTTALDVTVQKNILTLLKNLQQETGMSMLFITHDLSLVSDIADELAVMYKGEIAERGNAAEILRNPQHAYTKALLACRPSPEKKGQQLPVVAELMRGKNAPEKSFMQFSATPEKILSAEQLKVYFPGKKNIFGKAVTEYKAVDDITFSIFKNEIVGLAGESGCGKTTLGRTILGLIKPTAGNIIFNKKNIAACSNAELRLIRKDLQIVFQDPYGSLNPRLTIGDAITEPMQVHSGMNRKERKEKAEHLLGQVNMDGHEFNRYPHQFSGGQRQRICIARALSLEPDFLVFDEAVSALDVSVQAQVLNLINELKNTFSFTALFISHDLRVIQYICDRVMIMQAGKIIETGSANEVFFSPKENYTKELLSSIPGGL